MLLQPFIFSSFWCHFLPKFHSSSLFQSSQLFGGPISQKRTCKLIWILFSIRFTMLNWIEQWFLRLKKSNLPSSTSMPSAFSKSLNLLISSFSSRISLAFASSLTTALHTICLARSAYLNKRIHFRYVQCPRSKDSKFLLPKCHQKFLVGKYWIS